MKQKGNLIKAEEIALELFSKIKKAGLISSGKTELHLNNEIFHLAKREFGINKHWHKRIVRCGKNTLLPYKENPPNLTIKEDDILFFDFGPVIEDWEADLGRTYVLGGDPQKLKLKDDTELIWLEAKFWFDKNSDATGAELYEYVVNLSSKYGWEFGGEIAGHIIGHFPHEKLDSKNFDLYIHPDNDNKLLQPDKDGNVREWILEIHVVDRKQQIGGFYEQLLT